VSVLVFVEGDDDLSLQAVTLAEQLGTPKVVRFDGPYAPAAWARELAAREWDILVGAGSDRGNEVLAHVAAQLDLPFAANVTDVRGDEITRQRWGGSLLEEARVHADRKLYTAAPFTFAASEGAFDVEVAIPELGDAIRVAEHVAPDTGGRISLADAKVVVSGGRGVGSSEGFAILEELAALLGGAVGCSRVVTSAGWRPHTDQVGQTGSKV
jgi:electron transfer flavoprotein alpha subunit